MAVPTQNLHGGHKIPVIGYGSAIRERVEETINLALETGYRHFDTAYGYGNEEAIGRVLKKWLDSGKVKRSELFIVTKLPSSANTPDRVEEYLKISLERLQLDYVDLYLIHHAVWFELKDPSNRMGELTTYPTDHISIWKKMEEQVDAGRTKAIGVSNFNISQLDKIVKAARILPAALQIENHIYLQQKELVKYCQNNGIVVVAYSPLGGSRHAEYTEDSGLPKWVLLDPTVAKIAEKYKKSPGQVLLKFNLQRNIVVIPKSSSVNRMKENIDAFNFTINDEDFNTLRGLDVGEKARLSFDMPYHEDIVAHPEWPYPRDETYYALRKGPPKKQ